MIARAAVARRLCCCLIAPIAVVFIAYVAFATVAVIYNLIYPINTPPASCPAPNVVRLSECLFIYGHVQVIMDIPTSPAVKPLPLLVFGVGCCGRQPNDYDWLASLPAVIVRVLQSPYVQSPADQVDYPAALACAAKASLARLEGVVDPAAVFVGGHSMGGGLAFGGAKELTVRHGVPVRGLIALAPAAYTNPHGVPALLGDALGDVPLLAVGATADCVHPAALDVWSTFNFSRATRRALVVLLGAHHCYAGAFPVCEAAACPRACHSLVAEAAKERLVEAVGAFIAAVPATAEAHVVNAAWGTFERRLSAGTASGRWSAIMATDLSRSPSVGPRYQAWLASISCPMLDPCGAADDDAPTASIVRNTVAHRLQIWVLTPCELSNARSVYAEPEPLHTLLQVARPADMAACDAAAAAAHAARQPEPLGKDLVKNDGLARAFTKFCVLHWWCGMRAVLVFYGRVGPSGEHGISVQMTAAAT